MGYIKNGKKFVIIASFFSVVAVSLFTFDILPSRGDIKRPAPKKEITGNKFMGAGSCASSNCHGAAEPRNRSGVDINQNEFSIWFTKDEHRESFDALLEPESQQIARNLRLPEPAEESEKCLVCHTTYAPAALWGEGFDFSEGVSCETCHGPSEKWLGPHTASDWTDEKSLRLGMYDTENIFTRAQICVGCHIGDKDKTVDHEMIAAGHPDLNRFELDTFLAFMPPHWRKPEETGGNLWTSAENWSVGQTTALKQSMEQLARRAGGKSWHTWPEFAEFDCFSCHHDLKDDSWRQARGYRGRTPGIPPWNASRYVLIRPLAGRFSPGLKSSLDREISTLSALLNKVGAGDSARISQTAARIADLTNSLEAKLQGLKFDEDAAYDLMLGISADGEYIAGAGARSAQQAVVALETLFFAYSANVQEPSNQQISDAIGSLLDYLEQPANYEPGRFAGRMRSINRLLRNSR